MSSKCGGGTTDKRSTKLDLDGISCVGTVRMMAGSESFDLKFCAHRPSASLKWKMALGQDCVQTINNVCCNMKRSIFFLSH